MIHARKKKERRRHAFPFEGRSGNLAQGSLKVRAVRKYCSKNVLFGSPRARGELSSVSETERGMEASCGPSKA